VNAWTQRVGSTHHHTATNRVDCRSLLAPTEAENEEADEEFEEECVEAEEIQEAGEDGGEEEWIAARGKIVIWQPAQKWLEARQGAHGDKARRILSDIVKCRHTYNTHRVLQSGSDRRVTVRYAKLGKGERILFYYDRGGGGGGSQEAEGTIVVCAICHHDHINRELQHTNKKVAWISKTLRNSRQNDVLVDADTKAPLKVFDVNRDKLQTKLPLRFRLRLHPDQLSILEKEVRGGCVEGRSGTGEPLTLNTTPWTLTPRPEAPALTLALTLGKTEVVIKRMAQASMMCGEENVKLAFVAHSGLICRNAEQIYEREGGKDGLAEAMFCVFRLELLPQLEERLSRSPLP
tara:strand:- start:486 stop:1529 length:1044 start_codon:yes stop_codon:yes gene_type:complete